MAQQGKKIIFTEEDKNKIKELYLKKELSSIEIGKIYGVSFRLVLNKLKEWNIKTRAKHIYTRRRKNNLLTTIKSKQENGEDWGKGRLGTGIKFNLEKINHEHWNNEKSIRDIGKEIGCSEFPIRRALKKNGYKIRKFGVITNRRREKIGIMKRGKTLEEIYSKDIAKKMKKNLINNRAKQIFPLKDSSIEIKIQNFLKQLGIEFFTHQYMKIEHGYQCDILIPSMNLVIECDGDYWHKYPIGNDLDHIRTKELKGQGYKVLRLWEHEIKKMSIQSLKSKLLNMSVL